MVGITLIALIVTIVVLLILAGITLSYVFGDGGILNIAKEAADKTNNAVKQELNNMGDLANSIANILGESSGGEAIPANYSIKNEGKKTYYERFSEAYGQAVDNGGENEGGTIVVEKDVTENMPETLEINKTIEINTNGRDFKIERTSNNTASVFNVTSGTLTIKGDGKIENADDVVLFNGRGGNIVVNDSPTLSGGSHAIYMKENYNGQLDINGGYITSTLRSAITLAGNGATTIDNAQIFTKVQGKNAILSDSVGQTGTLTISGNTKISNVAESGNTCAISYGSTGKLTINAGVVIEGMGGINVRQNGNGNSAEVEINNATMIGKGNGTFLQISGNGPVTVNGGSITAEKGTGIKIYDTVTNGSLTLNNAKVTAISSGGLDFRGNGNITLNNTKVRALGNAVWVEGNQNVQVHDSVLVAEKNNASAVGTNEASRDSLTIDGKSIIANGVKKITDEGWYPIYWISPGDLIIKGSTIVTGGIYGRGVWIRDCNMKIEDDASVFSGSDVWGQGIAIDARKGTGGFTISTSGRCLYFKSIYKFSY